MKSEAFGYTPEETKKIVAVITEMMQGAVLLETPVKWSDTPAAIKSVNKQTGKTYKYEALLEDDEGKKITVWLYYAPIAPYEFSLDCNHKIGFNTVEGMLRIYWRLTGNRFLGTEDFKGVYWLKNPMKDDYVPDVGLNMYSTWISKLNK